MKRSMIIGGNSNMDSSFVSVILDNYNYGRFISEAIESVLNQTYKNYELIIVDDGSTDNSKEIIMKYAEEYPQIRTIYKENGGQTSAFNAGFEIAKGNIIAFLDSDDYWYPNKLEKIVLMHKQYDLVQHYLSYNGDGIYRKVNVKVDWHEVLIKYGYLYNHSVCSSLSFTKNILNNCFPLSDEKEMITCTDGVLWMMALSMGKVGMLEDVLGFYRVHGNNLFVNCEDTGEKAMRILEKQHWFVNKELKKRNLPEIPFSNTAYFEYLLEPLIIKGNSYAIYGTECSGRYITEVVNNSGAIVSAYVDSNEKKWGKDFLGKKIISPQEIAKRRDEYDKIIIASSAGEAISDTLEKNNLKKDTDYILLPI